MFLSIFKLILQVGWRHTYVSSFTHQPPQGVMSSLLASPYLLSRLHWKGSFQPFWILAAFFHGKRPTSWSLSALFLFETHLKKVWGGWFFCISRFFCWSVLGGRDGWEPSIQTKYPPVTTPFCKERVGKCRKTFCLNSISFWGSNCHPCFFDYY